MKINQQVADEIQNRLSEIVPFVRTSISSLGNSPSLAIRISLDEKDTWQNGIFENSRYSIFMIHQEEGKIEQLSLHYQLKKFRKCRAKSVDNVVQKITQWAQSNS